MSDKPNTFSLFTQSSGETFTLTVNATVTTKKELDWLCRALTTFRDFLPSEIQQSNGPTDALPERKSTDG